MIYTHRERMKHLHNHTAGLILNTSYIHHITPILTINLSHFTIPQVILLILSHVTILYYSTTLPAAIKCMDLEPLKNGRIFFTNSTNFGSVAKHICFLGYKLSGNFKRVCNGSGNWTGSPPTCIRKYSVRRYRYRNRHH